MIPREACLGVVAVAALFQEAQLQLVVGVAAEAKGFILFYSRGCGHNVTELIHIKLLSSKSPKAKTSRHSLSKSRSRSASPRSRSRSASKGRSVSRYK